MKIVIKTTKKLFVKLLIFSVFVLVLAGVIGYARGYRFNLSQGKITSTGILSVSSLPKPASIFVNGELSGATDSNITLPYGTYDVEVRKEGYSSWKRTVALKGELVMSLNARLFLKNPGLTPLTNIGVTKVIPVGNTDRLIAISKSEDPEKSGIYIYDSSSRPISIFSSLSKILSDNLIPDEYDLTSAEFVFNPNYTQAIATFYKITDLEAESISYLLNLSSENTDVYDISNSKDNILSKWSTDRLKELEKIVGALPKKIQPIATESMYIISTSPDDKKILYVAITDNTLPLVINPALIGSNQATETRNIESGKVYIYDKREDKNFEVALSKVPELPKKATTPINPQPTPTTTTKTGQILSNLDPNDAYRFSTQMRDILIWFSTSDYLAVKEDEKISMVSYDNQHKEVVYAGPFDNKFFGISPNSELLLLINLNPQNNNQGDLYSISLL